MRKRRSEMRDSAVTKVCADICFVLGFFCLYPPLNAFIWPLLALVLACLVDGLVLVRIKSKALRAVLALLPALCLLFAKTTMQYVAIGVAVGYYLLFAVSGLSEMELWTYRSIYTAMLVVNVFALIILLIGGFAGLGSVLFCLLFIGLGALTLRKMRMGASMSFKWNMSNLTGVVVPVLAAIGASVVVYYILVGIMYLLSLIIVPNIAIADKPEFGSGHRESVSISINQDAYVMQEIGEAEEEDLMSKIFKENFLDKMDLSFLKYVLLGVVALVVFILVFRYLRMGRRRSDKEAQYEDVETGPSSKRARRRKQKVSSNAQKVRKIYREYLFYLSGKGVFTSGPRTSAEILDDAKKVSGSSSNDELRDIYIKARYGGAEAVTDEDVAFAKRKLDDIKAFVPAETPAN